MAPVRLLLGGRFSTAMRGVLALLCLLPQGGLALAAAPPAYAPQEPSEEQRALVACTPTGTFTNCTRFTYSGGDQTFTVPAGVTSVYARLWGGGGGGSPSAYYTGQFGGGGGGFTTGTIAVTPGQSLTVTSGQGGLMNRTTAVYGGGGPGGRGGAGGGLATGASGGGMSAVWNGNYGGTPLLIAGGGGGSSPGADTGTPAAGGGGGTNGGQDNRPASSGRGGTQSAGGAAATQTSCGSATAGSRFLGGSGAPNNNEGGGGGGGGLYGGGGGACQGPSSLELNGMGGGGSGYTGGTGVTNAQTAAGANSAANGQGGLAAGRDDALYGSGIGNGGGTANGGNGEVTLEWVTQIGLSIRKTAAPTAYVPGQSLTYTVVVSNAGPAPAVGAAVRDALPAALSGFTWTCSAGSASSGCGDASGTGSIDTTATVAVNDSVTYTVTGTVPSGTTGTLSNTATVTRPSATTDPNCGPTCSSSVDTPGRVTTGLSVTKTPDKNPYVPGQPLTYTIVVKNAGPSDAVGTSVADKLPNAIQGFTWKCTASSGSSCGATASGTGDINTTVTILAGGQVSYTLTGTVPSDANGSLDNRATVNPPTGATDPNCSPKCTSTANPIPPGNQANLVVSKTLLTSPVVPGQQVKWQVKVTNNGPSRARNVVVTDQVPAGVTGAAMVNDQDGSACPVANGTATCPAVEIPVNGTASWTLSGTLDPNATTTPTNSAVVTGGPDPSASSRTAVASPTATPTPQAGLTISKTLLTSPVVPGQQIQWRVTVANSGPSRARNVVVTDQVPAGVSGASMKADADGTACSISGGVATCPAVEIPAGSSASWTLSGTLSPDATTTPTNTAVVTGGPDPSATARTAVASPSALPTPQANLVVSKSLLTSPVVPGQQVQWRVTVANSGPSRARNVVVTDQVPAGVSGASMKADADGTACSISGGVATCPAVEIPAGSSASWTLSGSLDPNATTTPTNTVTVTGGPDPSASTRTAVASPTAAPTPQAGLKVSKSLVTNPVVPGQQIQWQINVFNSGPSRARNVVVGDQIPAGVNNATMTGPNGTTCPIANGVATCPAVEIPAGQALNWTLTGTLDPNATATPTNTVTVTGGPDPTASTHTAVASPSNSPVPQANLAVSKVLLTSPVVPGQQVQWQVSVTNNGPSRARNVVVTDQVPAGVSGASMTGSDGSTCPISGGVATCPAVEIPAGQTMTWMLSGTLDPNATATPSNTVTVTGGPDPTASTHTAVASPSNSPSPQANLSVSKVLLTNPVVPGQQIQWRVSVTNNGPSRARNVVVTDQVPSGVADASMRADAGGAGCPISGGVATCPAVEIPAGQTLTWTLTGTLASDATATPTNTVTVTGGPDPTAATHTAVASPSNSPSPQANLTVSKVLLTNPVVPGQQIQWQVSVTNSGPSRARNVVVTDQVPAGVSGASMAGADGSTCVISGGVATCPAVEIPAGQTMTWTLSGTLDPNATTTPTNSVTVTGGPDPTASSHTAVASPTSSPTPQAGLSIGKVLLTNPVVPGQQIQWQVTVTNNGPSRARNVVVTDQVPASVNGASMTADADGANCPVSSGVATCPAVEIPAGQALTWTLSGTLSPDATTTPTNTAVVTGGPDPAATARTAVASPSSSPTPQAKLVVSKALLTDPVVPGQQVQWRVTVTNNGPSRARNVVVTDTVPAGVNDPSMAASDGTACPIANGTATCPAVEIPAGSSATWTLTGTLAPDATVTPTNTVTVTGGPDPSASTHTAVASPTSTPSAQAKLVVSKVLLTDPVVPGQQVQWRVSVTNNGPSRARNVVVTDQVPAGVSGASMTGSDGSTCPITSGVATCPAVEIPAGQTMTWTLSGTLDANATTTPTNTAVVTGGPDPTATAHTAVASPSTSPSPRANLTVSKSLLTNPVVPGQQVQWRVSVTNSGPSRARNVVVTDQVPAGVSGASMAGSDGSTCPISGGVATCPAVEIPAGQTMTWTLTGTLAQDATVTPTNTVTVTGGPDPTAATHTAVASPSNSPSPQANLTVSKSLLTNPVVPGQQIQWRVSVTNNGPSRARNVVVTDQVPTGVSAASMAADADGAVCPISGGVATCPAVEIPAGQTVTWTLTGTLASDATATPSNTVTVTGGPDPTAATHTAVASPSNSPSPQANLTVSKVLLTNPVVPGQQIQWRVTVTNNGPSRARNVVVTDTVPTGVNAPSMAASDGTACPIANGTATCPAVEIPAGSSATWTLTGTLAPDATVTPTNTVTVTGGPDPSTSTHTAVASPSNSPSQQAKLSVSKVLLTDPVVPGQQVQWRVSVTNNGPSRARNVVVTDQVPSGVNGASMAADADGSTCPIANGVATCPAVEIPVGQTATWTLSGTLDANATSTPTNTAVVTGGPDPTATAHTAVASPSNSPSPQANLSVSKALLTDPVVPGQQVQWRVSVTNNGPSRARNVVVTDQVPSGVNDASMRADAGGAACPISGGVATCPAVEIPAGSSASWTLTGTLAPDATVTPTNTAVVTGGPDPTATAHTAVASPTSTPSAQAKLVVSKVLLTDPVVPGQQVQWRVSVTNNGPSRARNVVVTDQVPAGVSGASMAGSDGSTCPIASGVATCPAVEIPAGQTMTWTLSGTLDSNATTTPTNTAVVTGGPDPTATAHTAVASPSTSPSPRANLTVSKVLLTNPVVPGQQIQWRVSVTNNGPSRARNVVVTDQVPAGVNDASMLGSDGSTCPIANGVATCPAMEIPAGQTMTWTLSGTLDPNATATPGNTVTVTGGPDPTAATHTAVASPSNSPSPRANLTVSKSLLTNPVVPGQQIQWRVSVTNNGPSRARNVVVTDTVPTGVNDASMRADAGGAACPISGGVATCPAVEIPAGQTLTWTLTGTLASDATATPTNTVTVTGGPDPTDATHTAVASPSNSPSPQANLTVSKVLLTNPVVPGQQIQWQVSVTNNGPSRARNVVVTDRVPVGVSGASMTGSDGSTCPISGGVATCPAVEIPAGQTMTWTLSGTLDPNATTTPTNSVTVTGGPDPTASSHTAVASPTSSPTPQAGLSIGKVLLTNPVVPGQQIQWRVTVTNSGPSRARNVVVMDQVPTSVNSASMTADADGSTCPIASGVATCPAVEIPAGQTMTWTLSGTLDPNATSTPGNTAVVTGGPDPSATAHTAVASPSSSPSPQANLSVSKVLLTDPVVPGQQIQWRVTVTNNGPSRARNVVVTDAVPAGVNDPSMVASDGTTCPIANGTATCPAVEIPAGSSATWTLTGTLAPDATVTPTNTAVVTGGPDPTATAHTAVASPSNSPSQQARLTVSKVLLTDPVVPGQQVQWRVSVTNNGPSRARNVVVTDQVPSGVNGASMTADADGSTCPIANGVATCPAVEIPVGQTLTWTLSGTLDANATSTPTNTAVVTGGPDPSATAHTAVASPPNSPSPQAKLTVSKVLLTNPVVPGQQIQWRVTVANNGPSRARNVVVTDLVPSGVNGASMKADADGSTCPIANGVATCPAVEIPVGQTVTWTLTGTLSPDATVTPTNTATVTGGPDPTAATHTAVASPSNSPLPQANLSVSKVLLTSPVVPGQQIQWRVTVTNNGPSRARNVVVTDRVPDGVSGAGMTAADGTVCPITNGTAACPAIELEVGQSQTYTLSGTLMQDATVTPTNTAVVTGGPDPSATAHTAVASPSNSPSPQAKLTVSKVLLTNPVVPGEEIQWRVSVTNNGPSRARNVVVSDRIPDGVSDAVLQSDADASRCPITGGTAVCPAIELEVGQTASYTLTGRLAPDATVTPTNTAVVTGGPDPSATAHTAVASPSNSPLPQANLSIAKVLVTNPVVPGQQIQWRVSVTNNGPSRARNVVVTDTIPAMVNAPGMASDTDGSTCPISNGVATCPAVEIPAGSTVSYTVTGTLDPAATSTPANVAVVTGGPDPTATAHTATAEASETVVPQARLSVSKVLLTDPVVPGQRIEWRISVTNNGPSRARNVVVSDRLPDGVVGAELTPDATHAACPVSGGVATCPAVEIPVGGTATYTVAGILAQDATTVPGNIAVVTGGPDPSATAHTAVASPTGSPSPQARLSLAKVLVTDPVVPGGTIQWRVTVTNQGPSRARNVVVTDRVPDGVTGAMMVSDEDGTRCAITNGVAGCPAIELEVGQMASYTLSGTLAADAVVTPTNTATATGGPDPSTPTHTAVASPTNSPSPQANLSVSKVLVTDPVVPGQQIQWRVTVTNHGPSRARNVVVTDRVPAGVSNASMVAQDGTACPIASGTATCPAVEIPAGQTLTWTLSGTLDANATVTPINSVTVTGGPDPTASSHTAVASPSNSPSPQANLSVSKVLLTNPVVPGQQVQWRVSVTNNGPSRARNVVVTDQVPSGVNGASMVADADGANCPIGGGVAMCPAVEIAAGGTVTWTLTGTLSADATVTPSNTVTVTGGPDPSTPTHTAVASSSNSPLPQANLVVSKVLVTDPVVPGQQIQWRVTVTNNGPSRARNVVVTDRIPDGVLNASMSAQDGTACSIANGTATCPAVEIAAGGTVTWTLTGTLAPDATVTPTNTAVVTGGPDPTATAHTAVASPTNSPSPQANLSVSKVLLTNPVVPGQQIQWRVSVTNNGPSRARNVVVTDQVPAGVSNASMAADAGGANCPISGGVATCPAVEIPAGQTVTWTLTGTLSADATVTPSNTVTVTGGPDPSTPTHTAVASSSNSPLPQANLVVSKVLVTDPVVPGQQIQWRVTVTNNGPSRARNVVVTDRIPDGVLNASMSAQDGTACSIANGTATCPAVEIAAGGTATWTLTGTLAPDATLTPTNTAVVTGGPDPTATAHTAVASPTNSPSPQANLSVSKVLLTNPVVPGQQIQWRVTVTNNGPSRARNVVVTDQVPAGVSNASMAAQDGTACPIANGVATCPAVEIPAGDTVTWTLSGTLDANATVTPINSVTVTGGPDPSTPTHTAVASPSNSPLPQANLSVSKVLLTNPVVPGQQIQWRVSVTNNGPSRARNVVVTDQVPAGVSNASMAAQDGTACPIANGTATCPAVEILAGGTVTWTLTGTLDADATVTPTNSVTVTGGPDPSTPVHTATASPSGTPEPQANLVVSKVLVTDPVVPGRQIQWQVSVRNDGPSRARNVVVSDQVPAGVLNASMASQDGTVCPIVNGTATCPAVEIPVGGLLTWTLTGTLDPAATVTPTNTALVTGGPDPSAVTHTAVASPSTGPVAEARLSVAKVLVTDPVVPGGRIEWRVTVTNQGPSVARDVVVTDRVPDGVLNASMTADDGIACPIANGTATCPAVGIAVGATRAWTLTGTLDAGATVTPVNTATVTGGPDPVTPTHTAVASPSSSPSAQARLTVAKVLVTNPVVPGAPIEWQVTVTNDGPSTARGVVVTDRVPAGVSGASMTGPGGASCTVTDGTATCPAVEIPVGRTLTWILRGTLDPAATVTPANTVTVTGGPDPVTPTHTAVASPSSSPSGQARLTVAKVLLTSPVVAGQQIRWRVTVTNDGPSLARNVVVTDEVPAGVNDASMTADADGTPCPVANGTATCPAVEIPVGTTLSWTLTGTLDPNATAVPVNTVVVTGGPDPSATAHTAVATPTEPITVQHDLLLSKQASPANPKAGDTVTYTVTATNRASGTYLGAVVTDDLSGVLDGAVYDADARASSGRTAYAAPRLTWTLDLLPGATETLTYTVTVKSDAGGTALVNRLAADGSNCSGGNGARRAVAGNCSTTTTVRNTPSPSPTSKPPLPPTGSGNPFAALLATVVFLVVGGSLIAARRDRRSRR
ncbi:hypothetical protein [Kitasatospora sp. NPDC059827]|uniref:DUF7927 domain-containing protein n=1 Tax=Kitasatospora sp. NPDC059827 TaxID=3346964 RepID=UPI00365A09FA